MSFVTAALGGSIEVETLDGQETVKIEAGTQPGQVIPLRGLGVAQLSGGGRGNFYVHVRIPVPKKLSRKQRKALEEFRTVGGDE